MTSSGMRTGEPGRARTERGGPTQEVDRPPLRTRLVERARLDARLDDAVQGRLAVVCAGPGWGKTSAVRTWLAGSVDAAQRPVAWLTLEAADDDPVGFWQRVLDAIAGTQTLPADHPLLTVRPSAALSAASIRAVYRALAMLPQPVLLILDDFHAIRHPEVLESLDALLQNPLPVHLLLITRVDPPLVRHRLLLDADYDEIRADVLGFTVEELLQLSDVSGVPLTLPDAAVLVERTEGWPAGLRLALLHLAGDDRRTVDTFLGGDRSVAEYLVAEVLSQLTPPVQRFLLVTSVCSRLDVDLASAIHPGAPAREILDSLVAGNYFVDRSSLGGGTYTYHPLLREMLVATLRRDDPSAHRVAHTRAAQWLADHDEGVRALHHAVDAGDWRLFGDIVVDVAAPEVQGPWRQSMLDQLAQVPTERASTCANLALSAATLSVQQGRFEAAEAWVDRARALLDDSTTSPGAATALLGVLSAVTARGLGDADQVLAHAHDAERQIAAATHTTPAMDSYAVIASVAAAVGSLWTGDLSSAERRLLVLRDVGRPEQLGLTLLNARSYLAFLHVLLHRLDDADSTAAAAIEDADRRGWASHLQLRLAHVTRALVADLHGDADGAGRHLTAALTAEVGGTEPPVSVVLHLARTSVAVAAGHRDAAARAWSDAMAALAHPYPAIQPMLDRVHGELTSLVPERDVAPPPGPVAGLAKVAVQRRVLEARAHLLRGDPAAAVRAVGTTASPAPDVVDEVERLLVLVTAYERLGRHVDADRAARAAVEAARAMALRRPFLAPSGAPSRAVVTRTVGRAPTDRFASSLMARGIQTSAEPAPLVSPLTERELAVLTALATMQSNEEIARELYVSVNTVKAHLKSLYRKLAVGSRREAVRRGRALNLIP